MEFSEELKQIFLETFPEARLASGGREILMRCRFCNEGKHVGSKHMYVSLGNSEEPAMFNCKLCNNSGVVTNDTLMMWGIFNVDLSVKIAQHNKKVLALPKNFKYKDSAVYTLFNTFITPSRATDLKIKYINDRLGINLSANDLASLKIVPNLYDLFNCNKVDALTRDERVADVLDKCFLGFISQDNAFLNMRNAEICKVPDFLDKRYINYNIFGKVDNTQRFYVIPTNIDLRNPQRIKIHLSEGVFDILSVFLNVRRDPFHNIYGAVCGTGYLNVIKHFIIRMKLTNIEFHIYNDNDVDISTYETLLEILQPYKIPLYIHMNKFPGEKDFGVPLEKINEIII